MILKVVRRKAITGIDNIILNQGMLLNVDYDIVGDNNRIIVNQGAMLSNILIYIRGDNHLLKIGENCQYKGGSIWFEDRNCKIEIGRDTTVESAHIAATEPNSHIKIGEDCMLSTNVEFRTGDSHSIIDVDSQKRINHAQNIQLDNHVWIGANAVILKGVKIERNSIVATNSVVTKSIPPNCIVAGIPAKVIRRNVDWLRERIYD